MMIVFNKQIIIFHISNFVKNVYKSDSKYVYSCCIPSDFFKPECASTPRPKHETIFPFPTQETKGKFVKTLNYSQLKLNQLILK